MLDITERIYLDDQVIILMSYLYQWVALAIVDGRPLGPRNMVLRCSAGVPSMSPNFGAWVPSAEHGSMMFYGALASIVLVSAIFQSKTAKLWVLVLTKFSSSAGLSVGSGSIVSFSSMDGIWCRNKIYRGCIGFLRFPRCISRLGEKDDSSTMAGGLLGVAVVLVMLRQHYLWLRGRSGNGGSRAGIGCIGLFIGGDGRFQ